MMLNGCLAPPQRLRNLDRFALAMLNSCSVEATSATAASRYAGSRVARVEDQRLLTGEGTFVDDVVRPGMLHVCFVRSPVARARVGVIDTAAARALRGVRAIFTADDLNP